MPITAPRLAPSASATARFTASSCAKPECLCRKLHQVLLGWGHWISPIANSHGRANIWDMWVFVSGFIFFLRMQLVCCAVLGKPKWNTHPLINQAGPTTVGLKCDPTRWEDPLVQIRPSDSWRSETSMPLMVEELSRLAVGRARQAMMLTVSKGVVSL